MKRWGSALCALLLAGVVGSGCTPNKEQGGEDYHGEPAKYDAYGINIKNDNVGTDKGPAAMLVQKNRHHREPDLVRTLEAQAERIPGVVDIKVLAYKDNLLIGVLPDGATKPDSIDPTPSVLYTPGKPARIDNGHTDRLQQRVAGVMRSRLQAQTRYNIMYVSTNPAVYQRIADIHQRVVRGERVPEDEFQTLLNDIGYTTKGFNLVD
ncbi:YhcN/YlaJ family sporulation lipoprotein [Brevibacillus borstelensis]|uniref:YhcN/YlaJ family sporulation lipoprotein n=1 Tax=Brevibacillus TaxID=55080 RepID=UPI000F09592B|nr:YhcN/YlaJ family sporulation lipoprotein [Brevibacillus borstelensis]MCC0565312.1 YhcN/YlaJ family sporulation lipoprotein [Brevibacillus borstelensis]MCM3470833.1 YhcN/YlaJ family sporulation lipoprotein [Brevibacillus borstelensis]MCM3559390.1 YhcN/YlaJ family sporulation lipoprotein [Brevibacillus borstelensis]MCM3622540.1 YhcN/YlaJ family sporulation lipoprotein [Brevibacillus borstelensis]MED1873947.1 YhcN/YlaJ family sporulation lipoprotein [Brevibacillus borstelensis]